jgi:hypothetical protein
MATPDRNNGGALAGVRLTEVPIVIRRRVGRALLERAIKEFGPFGLEFAAELHRAVEEPSDRVYWVSPDAKERVLG